MTRLLMAPSKFFLLQVIFECGHAYKFSESQERHERQLNDSYEALNVTKALKDVKMTKSCRSWVEPA